MHRDPHPNPQQAGLHHAVWQLQQEVTRSKARKNYKITLPRTCLQKNSAKFWRSQTHTSCKVNRSEGYIIGAEESSLDNLKETMADDGLCLTKYGNDVSKVPTTATPPPPPLHNKQHSSWNVYRVCTKKVDLGSRHSSVDPSAPTIMWPWFRIPRRASTLFQCMFELWCETDANKQKEAGIGQYLFKS